MRVPLLLISFVLFLSANAQKVEFELNLDGGISLLGSKKQHLRGVP